MISELPITGENANVTSYTQDDDINLPQEDDLKILHSQLQQIRDVFAQFKERRAKKKIFPSNIEDEILTACTLLEFNDTYHLHLFIFDSFVKFPTMSKKLRGLFINVMAGVQIFKKENFFKIGSIIDTIRDLKRQAVEYFIEIFSTSNTDELSYDESILHNYLTYFEIFDEFKSNDSFQQTIIESFLKSSQLEKALTVISLFGRREKYNAVKDIFELIVNDTKYRNIKCIPKFIRIYTELADTVAKILIENKIKLPNEISKTLPGIPKLSKDSLRRFLYGVTIPSNGKIDCLLDYYRKLVEGHDILLLNHNNHVSTAITATAEVEKLISFALSYKDPTTAANLIIKYYSNHKAEPLNKALIIKSLCSLSYQEVSIIGKILAIIPEELDKVLNSYYQLNKIKDAIRIYKMSCSSPRVNVSENLLSKIKLKAKLNFLNYKYNECANDFEMLLEYIKTDEDLIQVTLDRLIHENKQKEIYQLLKQCNRNPNMKIFESKFHLQLMNVFHINYSSPSSSSIIDNILTAYSNNEEYNTFYADDYFGPKIIGAYSIGDEVNVYFIDNVQAFQTILCRELMSNDIAYTAIDTEWKQNLTSFEDPEISILQLALPNETAVVILDMQSLLKDQAFVKFFSEFFQKQTLVSYGFNKNDITNLRNSDLISTFSQCHMIDIAELYKLKYHRPAPSVDKISFELLGKHLCKYEQCSNWENRPLRKRQLHYAAMDALILVKLFKVLA